MTKMRSTGKGKRLPQPKRAPARKARAARPSRMTMNPYVGLLADPCFGDINAASPFEGVDLALAMRTVDILVPGTVPGQTGSSFNDVWCLWQPGLSTSASLANNIPGSEGTGTYQQTGANVTALSTILRCKASCLEWIPTGPVALRAGLVGLIYSPTGTLWNPTDQSATASQIMPYAQRTDANGSVKHEVRWIPNHNDGNYTINGLNTEAPTFGNAAVAIVIKGCDCNAGIPNGYFKITTVWEYAPYINAGGGTSARAAPAAVPRPPPYTLNQALRSVPNLLALAIDTVGHGGAGRTVLQAAGRLLGAGAHYNPSLYGPQPFGGGARRAVTMEYL